MKIQRVYIDTSVVGGCHDDEFAPWSNGLIEDFRIGIFKPVVSKVVALEVVDAPEPVQKIYVEILSLDHEFLDVTTETTDLADCYLQEAFLRRNTTMMPSTLLWRLSRKRIY